MKAKSSSLSTVILCIAFNLLNAQTLPLKEAHWITIPWADTVTQRPCLVFSKTFQSRSNISHAQLFITALGLYEAILNTKRVGNAYLTPGWTVYNKQLQYQQYDVTNIVRSGANKLDITVGEGWYRGPYRGTQPRDNYGSKAGLLASLLLTYADGTTQIINTDESWQTGESPIRYAELYNGEFYDSRFRETSWRPALSLDKTKNILVADNTEPVTQHETIEPIKIIPQNAAQVIDFGQNLAGWVQLQLKGKPGDTVRIEHAEVLDKDGSFYTGNLREAKATDTYILNGSKQILNPHFTYHGFRYARLTWIRNGKTISAPYQARAVALYSDLTRTGEFSCSDSLLNRLQLNIEWSLKSNFVGVPTDCPQRSERLGWTGDAQVFAATASYLYDTEKFYRKWLKDLAAEQGANGAVPTYVPTVAPYQEIGRGCAGWGDAATIVPWTVYQQSGDTGVLRDQYASMKGWVDYITTSASNGLWTGGGYGDWYAPGPKTDIGFIDQCFWAHSTQLVIQTAKILHETADIDKYEALLQKIKTSFNSTYLINDGRLASHTQAAYVLALQFDMLEPAQRSKAMQQLVQLIHENREHLATGFLGTPYLLSVLSANGSTDLAYTLLRQDSYPSWLFPVKMGATTIWEKWDGMDSDGTVKPTSYNHYSYGAVGQWLYENVAGIRALEPGYKKVLIAPLPGGGLTWAKGSYHSKFGVIRSAWSISENKINYQITIPAATTATIVIKGQPPVEVGPGTYQYNIDK